MRTIFAEKFKSQKYKLLIILVFTAISLLTFLSCSKPPQAPKDTSTEKYNDIIVPIVETKKIKRIKYWLLLNNEYKFRHKLLQSGDVLYVSLFDMTKMMNLKTDWSYNNNTISLFNNKDKIIVDTPMQSGRPALIRLEYIAISDYKSEEKLEKLRIISDYLYSKNIPFHITWISRKD